MVNYSDGKIYRIVNTENETVYIGSTCQALSRRLATHKHRGNGNKIVLVKECPCENNEQLRREEQLCIEEHEGLVNERRAYQTEEQKKEKARKYYESNREKMIESQRKYYEANREKSIEKARKYNEANREKVREGQRKYYESNREKLIESKRKYNEANREKVIERQRKYNEANREKSIEYQRKYYEANREKMIEKARKYNEANREKITCEHCGSIVSRACIARHQGSRKCVKARETTAEP